MPACFQKAQRDLRKIFYPIYQILSLPQPTFHKISFLGQAFGRQEAEMTCQEALNPLVC